MTGVTCFHATIIFLLLLHGTIGEVSDLSPVVLVLSKGRSGSSWMCVDIIPSLKPGTPPLDEEILGRGEENVIALPNPLEVAQLYLQKRRLLCPNKTIGFKWKPAPPTSTHHDELMKWVHENDFPVVHNHRNPLDLVLSVLKHRSDLELFSHCKTKECVDRHKNIRVQVNITRMLEHMHRSINEHAERNMQLTRFGIRFIDVYYDDLIYAADERRLSTLQSLIDFIYPNEGIIGTLSNLDSSQIEITTEYDHSKLILNFDEVVEALRGTSFEKYIHVGPAPNSRANTTTAKRRRIRRRS